jgi:ABC-type antimicrobial peptide transport system permease subunit
MNLFDTIAVLLALTGVMGVTAHSVAQRTRDMGIRLALGATKQNLEWRILKNCLRTALVGTAIGTLVGFWASRVVSGYLFGVSLTDPITYATVMSVTVIACLLGGYVPVRRIGDIDPVVVLRVE